MELLSSQWSIAESDLQEGLLRNGSIKKFKGRKGFISDDGKSRHKIKNQDRRAKVGKCYYNNRPSLFGVNPQNWIVRRIPTSLVSGPSTRQEIPRSHWQLQCKVIQTVSGLMEENRNPKTNQIQPSTTFNNNLAKGNSWVWVYREPFDHGPPLLLLLMRIAIFPPERAPKRTPERYPPDTPLERTQNCRTHIPP